MSTPGASVPPEYPPDPPRALSRAWTATVVAAAVLVLVAVGAAFVPLPYVSVSPGSAPRVDGLIQVVDGPNHPPKGEIRLATVSLGQRVTVYDALIGWLDDDVDVRPEDEIRGGSSRQEYRRQNIKAMDDSKQAAAYVALRRLGYPVKVTGEGALVRAVTAGQPADGVLRPEGDIVVAVDGHPIALADELVVAIRARQPGQRVRLRIAPRDGGDPREVDVTLAARNGVAFLGVEPETWQQRFELPFQVAIESDKIGGPSAGLAFTLALIDHLTPGELTGGTPVAATGTIEIDGRVGEVGGVAQKAVAVRRSGARLFLVPRAELAEARAHAGDLRVEGVDTLDEALAALATLDGSNALAIGTPGAPPAA